MLFVGAGLNFTILSSFTYQFLYSFGLAFRAIILLVVGWMAGYFTMYTRLLTVTREFIVATELVNRILVHP